MLELGNISRGSIVQQIIKSVENAILKKELGPGDPFPSENEMVKSLGVSKSSIREAVKMLEAMNVVEIRKGEGTFVRATVASEVINPLLFSLLLQQEANPQIIELRQMFEPAYSKLAMENATETDLKEIQKTVDDFRQNISAGTVTVEDDMAFHRAILQATHNEFVIKIGTVILELFTASVGKGLYSEPARSLKMHENIYCGLANKDEQFLIKSIEESIQYWE